MQNLINEYFQQTPNIQELVRQGKLRDSSSDLYLDILKQPGVLSRYSSLVLPSSGKPKFVSLAALDSHMSETLANLRYFSNSESKYHIYIILQ
jgi:hypothetical protein